MNNHSSAAQIASQQLGTIVMAISVCLGLFFAFSGAHGSAMIAMPVATAMILVSGQPTFVAVQWMLMMLFTQQTSIGYTGSLVILLHQFFPPILLSMLTLRYLRQNALKSVGQHNLANLLIIVLLFSAMLLFATNVCVQLINRALTYGNHYKLEPQGIIAVSLALILGSGFLLAYGALAYFRAAYGDEVQSRLTLHQVLHRVARSEERLLFRRWRRFALRSQREGSSSQ